MTLSKAIEKLSDSANRGMTTFDQDYEDAQKLGIEALKRIQSGRNPERRYVCYLLPGETED